MRHENLDLRRMGATLCALAAILATSALLLNVSSAHAAGSACSSAQVVVHLGNSCVLVGTPASVCPPSQSVNLGGICIGSATAGAACRTGTILATTSDLCVMLGTQENCSAGQVVGTVGACVAGSRDSLICTPGSITALIGSGCITVGTQGVCPPDKLVDLLDICIAPNPKPAMRRVRRSAKFVNRTR